MRGPYERLKYDLRRLWECPVCKRRERTSGAITTRHCNCELKRLDGKPVVMKLVEDSVQRLSAPIRIQHEAEQAICPPPPGAAPLAEEGTLPAGSSLPPPDPFPPL